MLKKLVWFAGSAGVAAVIAKYAYDKGYKAGLAGVENVIDDEYVVENLHTSDLADWFKQHNPQMSFTNIIIQPTKENVEKYGIDKVLDNIPDKCLFQCIYDEKGDSLKRFRMVSYIQLSENFEKTLEDSKGILIVEG